ncbi:MAG: arylsulfatase [Verrucomicrobiae bacterium]|nr:arylsulfatase [Verrucomicrobiae bacterium]
MGQLTALAEQAKPNIVYFLVDNLGNGEPGCYGGGILRGAETPRIDRFADEGMLLLNFAPETQCTPSRSALMTGRYSIRSGNHTVALAGSEGGLVSWERTLAEVLSDEGYATSCMGKWHIGASKGRWPTDQGFDEWYGPPHSYDEALWAEDPWYDPKRDPVAYLYEGKKGADVAQTIQLTPPVKRDLDLEYLKRSKDFIRRSKESGKPFFLYFNHTLMHLPTTPREEFAGKSGHGERADCLLQLDHDFGDLLDFLKSMELDGNTIVVFSGDNGPEQMDPWRGTAGFWDGSYFTGLEGSLRTPCLVRYPGVVPAKRRSNEIVHITDMFTTLLKWAGAAVPADRVIDGLDQRGFFEGKEDKSPRDGFPYWMGERMYGVKWHQFKMVMVLQRALDEPALALATPHIVNLDADPKERNAYNYPHVHSWVIAHTSKIIQDFQESVAKEPLIPLGAPIDFVPAAKQ